MPAVCQELSGGVQGGLAGAVRGFLEPRLDGRHQVVAVRQHAGDGGQHRLPVVLNRIDTCQLGVKDAADDKPRSEERRVGKECRL